MNTSSITHVAIVGAGPYGLSLAAHLRESDVPFRILGRPMQSWATQMPVGMKLKSDGFASNLSAGSVPFTLEDFCRLTSRPYHATELPVPVEDFVAYGREFQRRFVPTLDQRNVSNVAKLIGGDDNGLFRVTLEDGDDFLARHVVVATGVSLFQYIPEELQQLPSAMVTHSTDHHTFEEFDGRSVTVLGRGASSLNAAALLHESGADVTVLTRRTKIHVHKSEPPTKRSLYQRLRHPSSPLGSSMRSWLSCTTPGTFRALPYAIRRILVYKHLGPAGGTALQGRVEGKVEILAGWSIDRADIVQGTLEQPLLIKLSLHNVLGETREHITAHIIAGTGFRYNLARMSFLPQALLSRIRTQPTGAPVLNHNFESTQKGIYFVGPAASTSFGPLLRFAAGAGYAATRVTQHLVRDYARVQPRRGNAVAVPSTAHFERPSGTHAALNRTSL